jgi:hypothetical protein
MIELIVGYAAWSIIRGTVLKQEADQLRSDVYWDRHDRDEREREERRYENYKIARKERIESERKLEIEEFGAAVKRDKNDEWIWINKGVKTERGILWSVPLENGKISHELKLENGEIEKSFEYSIDI